MTTKNRGYRGWSPIEETKLVEILVNMVNSGRFKAGNGFKSGYLQHLEEKLKETFPDSGLLGKPHIESKVRTMKRDWQVVHDMFSGSNTSGFGWFDDTKLLSATSEVWDAYIKHHKEAAKWRNKPFPHYNELCTVFGKDRARGSGSRSFGDIDEETNIGVQDSDEDVQVEENTNTPTNENVQVEGNTNSPTNENVQVEGNTNIQAKNVSSVRSKKRKRKDQTDPFVDGLHEVVNVLGNTISEAASTMSRDIDFQVDLKMKRAKITTDIFKMSSLTQEEKYQVMGKIRSDSDNVEAYWDLDEENREGWVKYMLKE
ncbi:uncharacterized protein At2g29880-like [Rutidosis leptorrhynchoides]|uniref:uncharacterized protein At2g29880-like n=1 Tax=Rutidosis leptorrhynchoides TaxID=125765 RepID=UPI003A992B0B